MGLKRSPQPRKAHVWEKDPHGWYLEPAWCSRRLFEVEEFPGPIYDPACGCGTILREADAAGYDYYGSDIVNRRHHRLGKLDFIKRDFLQFYLPIEGSVVTNPPFDLVQEFCEHALACEAKKVALICLVRRLNAAHWLQSLPLQRVWLLSPRPSMPPGSWIAAGNKPGGGTQDFCWLVLESGYEGRPTIGWLHRDAKNDSAQDEAGGGAGDAAAASAARSAAGGTGVGADGDQPVSLPP